MAFTDARRRSSTSSALWTDEHWRSQSPSGSQRRKLSFHPVGEWVPPIAHEQPIAAIEISKSRRIAQVAVAVVYCLLAAGVVFGFAALKPVLIEEGVYRDRCTKQELDDKVWVCYEQELRLNFMFAIAAVSTNVAALPIGTILDRFGPRIASIIGTILLAIGALCFAFADDLKDTVDAYVPAYLFLALGGPFVFISSFQLSNTFPKHSGLILALITGAFDTSSAIFLLYRLIYQGTDGRFKPKHFFLLYLVVPALILLAQIFLMPGESYKSIGELIKDADDPSNDVLPSDSAIDDSEQRDAIQDSRREHREAVIDETTALLNKADDTDKDQEDKAKKQSGVWGALHGRTAVQQIFTPWFLLITIFTVIQMLRINYFVATIRTQYTWLLDSQDLAAQVNSFFDVALPLGGVIAVPFIGIVLDHTSTPFVLGLLVSVATLIGALGIVPQLWAAYANVVLFTLYRPLYYTAVSDYSAKVFGFATFGKVYGLIVCLAGLFNFLQAGLDTATHKVFGNDPVPVNAALLGLALVSGIALVGYVWYKARSRDRADLEDEAEHATETPMPGAPSSTQNGGPS